MISFRMERADGEPDLSDDLSRAYMTDSPTMSVAPGMPGHLPRSFGRYEVRGIRGTGGFATVYAGFDRRGGAEGFDERRARLREALDAAQRPGDLAALPPNDLATSPHAHRLLELGAFRADVSGAGPAVYGLFLHRAQAAAAERELQAFGRTWITVPTWYG